MTVAPSVKTLKRTLGQLGRLRQTNSLCLPDNPQVDGQVGQTVHALDISDTHEPTSTLLEEIAQRLRRLFSDDTVAAFGVSNAPCSDEEDSHSTAREPSSPCILRKLEIFCQGTER